MTAGLCDFCGKSLAHYRHDDCSPLGERLREEAQSLADAACVCHPVENPWTYYGIVEPGGALEPDYGCPVHFPENTSAAETDG
jgi:hypothetical protein